ncbi:flagellar biosynthetic protein FliO [Rhizobium wuzhouense]|uniref:Flagellar biosynthesis protein FliO n=1 Tax=Rhizobium wuzhouense TaxID=1986026 RepID=A0ABX5NXV3_9HYPH|nr:flagellar biosynthetic protein FliO [Rhizobium wuzhouense]PYB75242.1 hypothetical protein DMY87_07255 [Rhizobium wuzhouense]
MLDELISAYGSRFLVAALGVSLALLCLFIVLWILRNRAPSPFVRGGRNRQPRLQVLDAAAIDTRRRIVLIRRDNVEHLVMIGGPTDLVIESGIGDERHYLTARALQTAAADEEARLGHQSTASLPAAPPIQAPSLVADPIQSESLVPQPSARKDRVPQRTSQRPRIEQPDAAAPAVAAPRAPQPMTNVPQPRPIPTNERPAEDRLKAEPVAADAPKPPISAASPAPVTSAQLAAAPVATPVVPSQTAVAATATSLATGSTVPAAIATGSAISATFSPELHADRPVGAPSTLQPEPAVERPAPRGRLVEEPAPVVEPEPMVEAASREPGLEASVAPAVSIEPQPQPDAPAVDRPPQATQGLAPSVEAVRSPVIDASVDEAPAPTAGTVSTIGEAGSNASAEDVLEAARARVLSTAPADQFSGQFDETRFTPKQDEAGDENPQAEGTKRDLSDFERVLEEEMALHIAADPGPPRPEASPTTPIPALLPETRPDRPRPPIGAMVAEPRQAAAPAGTNPAQPAEEPNLQNEIARIFGEMSASRNP